MLTVKNLTKIYKTKRAEPVVALDNVSIEFPETGFVFLLGKSGSGKSTLLNSIGGLDKFDSGEIIIKGKSSKDFSQSDFDSYRNTFIGFIFQEYNILENFTVAKNLALALELQGKKANKEEVNRLLEQVDLVGYGKRKPNELSGGQKQRVAIARALIKNPEIIMADEPTGALDSNTGKQVMDTLKELSKTKLVIVVSHDREFAELYGDRIIELKDGKILSDTTKKEIIPEGGNSSNIKLIDGSIVYIKKGQKLSEDEMKEIGKFVADNAQYGDTFISFDEKANQKLKEGAKINDDGNKEKFVDTTEEDIDKKEYNPNSLKLIRSRLKFSDSFKMGASSLKSKVGKLIFTILLSFFAFTIFGVVDAFACWNRADSSYQAMQISNQRNLALQREETNGKYSSNTNSSDQDLASFQSDFSGYIFKGVVGSDYTSYSIKDDSNETYEREDSYGSYRSTSFNGFLNLTSEEMNKFGFTFYKGDRLPQTDSEISISKQMMKNLIYSTRNKEKKITEENIFDLNIYSYSFGRNLKIVSIIDDHTDFSKYENMTSAEMSAQSYLTYTALQYNVAFLAYVNSDVYDYVKSKTNVSFTFKLSQNSSASISSSNFYTLSQKYENEKYYNSSLTKEEFINNNISYYINGKENLVSGDNFIELGLNEIIVPQNWVNSATYEDDIADGLYLDFGTYSKTYAKLKVVGVSSGYSDVYVSGQTMSDTILAHVSPYKFILSALNGSNQDKALVKKCETFDSNGVRYTIQGSATTILNLMENIIDNTAKVFLYVGIVFAGFAALLLMNFISTSISYKKREIGVLRALGARGADIFGIFFNEATIIAFINFVLASVATFIICKVININLIKEYAIDIVLLNVSIRQFLLILGVSWGSALLASFIPTTKISRKKPIDAINNR